MQVVNPRIGSFSQPVEEPMTAVAEWSRQSTRQIGFNLRDRVK